MPRTKNTVAVIGAGITGVTTAYELAKAGFQVTLFDKHPYPAMETSFANGGQISASNAEVWNNWPNIIKGIKWILTPSAPLLINPRPTFHKISWIAEFLSAISKYEINTLDTAKLAIESRVRLKQIAEEERISFDCENRGILHFYQTKREFEHAERVNSILNRAGLARRPITPDEMRKLEPTLKGTFYGGFYTESDFTGDIHKFTIGLAGACQRLGVEQIFDSKVLKVAANSSGIQVTFAPNSASTKDRITRSFEKIVVCAGVQSRALAAQLGDRLNVYPVKGYSITVNLLTDADREAAPWTSLLDDDAKIVTSRLGNDRLRIAGTAELNGFNRDIRSDRIDPLLAWCRQHFPTVSTEQTVPWTGLRPMMPNMMPRVCRGRRNGVFYNTGHGHLGWTLSTATAALTAGLVAGVDAQPT